ncbi:MAG TPA: sialidase family protein [Terriglobales bacterium]|nr:sialidase family protein [Terriglobales bacterium]
MLRTHVSATTWRSVSVFCALLLFPLASLAQVSLNEISKDPFTNIGPQHATEVEPDTFSFGNTIVTAFQQGRFNLNGGCSDIGWATSLDGGMTWQNGSLPGLTRNLGGGKFARVSDPAVAFDAAHSTWMIASLPLQASGSHTAMLISRSSDGINWNNPVNVTPAVENSDKTWVACDNNTASPFYGHCYAEWDDNFAGDVIFLNTSTDGGMTWGPSKQPAGGPTGLGGQPMAQPGGRVIVPSSDAFLSSLLAYTSSDGGNTWTSAVTIAIPNTHLNSGGLRDLNLPAAAIDAAGKVFVAWHDCRFRAGCPANDIVYSTSTDGTHWSKAIRVPIDPTTSTVDHFIPGIEIEPGTSGSSAHIGLSYYFYPQSNCTASTCQLMEGYISSPDGGNTWTAPTTLAGPMSISSLPQTNQGPMVGDYQSLSFAGGTAHPVFAVANPRMGGKFDEAMYSPVNGLVDGLALYRAGEDKPVPNAHSDHLPLTVPVKDNLD